MNIYYELMKYPVFSIDTLKEYYTNEESARSAVKRLIKKGTVLKIRNNLYTCVSGETLSPIANRFQIASAINETSFVSHHTALEYYGAIDQVFYEVYVSSKKKFNTFEFDGYTYISVADKIFEGIEKIQLSNGVKISDKERTIIDSIKDMNKISGPEEVNSAIPLMASLDENRLLKYLKLYNNKSLYQRVGFMLEQYKDVLGISDAFFQRCKEIAGNTKSGIYDEGGETVYNPKWKLLVPKDLLTLKNGGDFTDDRI